MYKLKSYLCLNSGDVQEFHVKIIVQNYDNLNAVFIDGFSDSLLNEECGACIDIEIDDIESWMADYRHSE